MVGIACAIDITPPTSGARFSLKRASFLLFAMGFVRELDAQLEFKRVVCALGARSATP
jgi:hypothetical protein